MMIAKKEVNEERCTLLGGRNVLGGGYAGDPNLCLGLDSFRFARLTSACGAQSVTVTLDSLQSIDR